MWNLTTNQQTSACYQGAALPRCCNRGRADHALWEQADRWKPKLSEYDTDALTMYRHCDLLRSVPVSPGILEIEGAALYRRGQELAAKRDSDAFPDGVDAQEDVTGTLEAIINSALGRAGLPRLGYPKTARKEVVFCAAHQLLLLIFRQSWEQQLPSLPFPSRLKSMVMMCVCTFAKRRVCGKKRGTWGRAGRYSAQLKNFFSFCKKMYSQPHLPSPERGDQKSNQHTGA